MTATPLPAQPSTPWMIDSRPLARIGLCVCGKFPAANNSPPATPWQRCRTLCLSVQTAFELRLRFSVSRAASRFSMPEPRKRFFQPSRMICRARIEPRSCLLFDPTGLRLVTQPETNVLQMIDLASGKPIGRPLVHPELIESFDFGPDGSRLYTRIA